MESKYEIEDGNVLKIWIGNQEEPSVLQPHYPNGDPWTKEQAEAWGELYIISLTDENSALPGPSAEEPTMLRPVFEPVALAEETTPTEE